MLCLPASHLQAQLLSDPSSQRHIYQIQASRAQELTALGKDVVARLLEASRKILALPEGSVQEKRELLGEIQRLADQLEQVNREWADASSMAGESRETLIRSLESRVGTLRRTASAASAPERQALEAEAESLEREVAGLRETERAADPGEGFAGEENTLASLALLVEEEFDESSALRDLREELRLFLGGLRLLDETSQPPSSRSGGGGDQDPGCPPVACDVTGSTPADLPVSHSLLEEVGSPREAGGMDPASLAQLHRQIVGHLDPAGAQTRSLSQGDGVVTREGVVGMGGVAFRGDGVTNSVVAPGAHVALVFSRPVGGRAVLVVEPSLGGRSLRSEASFHSELAGELRETLMGTTFGERSAWQLMSWQKGRYRSEPLMAPGYLEPGRLEGGLAGRVTWLLDSSWRLEGEGGMDAVRYEPEDWKVLDRHGMAVGVGLARQTASGSLRFLLRGSHHRFPSPLSAWTEERADTRLGGEVNAALEGKRIIRLTLGIAWNDSRLPAYDFRSGRAAIVFSSRLGRGSIQGYAAFAHQEYLNPGPEDARIAPSDQDSGTILSLQYVHPMGGNRSLMIRGGWSRSQTGFRDDFYERFGISLHLAFRGD